MRIPKEARPKIMEMYRNGVSYKDIASEYGTTAQGIGYIVRSLIERGDPLAAGLSMRRSEGAKNGKTNAPAQPAKTMARVIKPHEKSSRAWSPADIGSDETVTALPSRKRTKASEGEEFETSEKAGYTESPKETPQAEQRRPDLEPLPRYSDTPVPRDTTTRQTLQSFADLELVNRGRGKYGDAERLMVSAAEASQSFATWVESRDSRDAKKLSAALEKLRDAINAMELDLSL